MTVDRFEQVAAVVAARVAELLCAWVKVVDERGRVVARSMPRVTDISERSGGSPGVERLRLPFRLEGQAGQILVGESPSGEAISPRLAQGIIDLAISQAAVVERLPSPHELKNKFILDLLRGVAGDEVDIQREGQVLGMDLHRPRAVILIDASDFILAPDGAGRLEQGGGLLERSFLRSRLVIASVVSFFELPSETICAYIGDGEVAVLKASTSQDLAAWTAGEDGPAGFDPSWANLTALKRAGQALLARLRRDTGSNVTLGIGRYHPGIRGLASSYGDARAALSLGGRIGGPNQVHCLDSLGIAALVGISDERTKHDLAMHLLSPLDHEPELVETLVAFFEEDCCPSSTASRVAIHRNTLSYRLDKVASLIGLDPRRFDEAVQIRLALVLRSLGGSEAALCRCPSETRPHQRHVGHLPDEPTPLRIAALK